ncbi:MAG TPA: TetR family transcriptional regulator [Pseudomonadales bacterium]
MDARRRGRANQRNRTRKDLLRAASRLLKQGVKPTLEQVAEEAMVSRATAYRYFSNVDALLLEAALDLAVPEPEELMRDAPAEDALARVMRVDDALHEMINANEPQIRMMLARSLERALAGEDEANTPRRQNRRVPLLEAALAPLRRQFRPGALKTLIPALALIVGTEGWIAARDVLRLDDAQCRRVKRWAMQALIEAAMKPDAQG